MKFVIYDSATFVLVEIQMHKTLILLNTVDNWFEH